MHEAHDRLSGARIPEELAKNLVSPSAYADARLFETYRWLRANNPLGWAEPEGFSPFWAVTKHADILEVSRQNALFHSGDVSATLVARVTEERWAASPDGKPPLRTLIHMDAPDHLKYRALTQKWFMPGNVARLESQIRGIARETVERMAGFGGRCDFATDVALSYPLRIIMQILGVPAEDEPRMLRLTQDIFSSTDKDVSAELAAMTPEQVGLFLEQVFMDFGRYFGRISAERRANPRDDLATVIATATIDGEPLSMKEATSYYIIVVTAGHDTTSSSTAGAFWALAERPEILAQVKADPSLIPALVEEAIRWTTPVKTFIRSATEDTELAGRRIAKGERLMLCYASGNRDEEVFDAPDEFRLDRVPNKQLAFGYGAHNCLGQHLARMEMRILFEELLPRLESVELDGEPSLTHSFFVNGPKSLPVRFRMK